MNATNFNNLTHNGRDENAMTILNERKSNNKVKIKTTDIIFVNGSHSTRMVTNIFFYLYVYSFEESTMGQNPKGNDRPIYKQNN